MKQDNTRSKTTSIGLAIGIPEDPQISNIENIDGYDVSVTFDKKLKKDQSLSPGGSIADNIQARSV